VGADGLQICWSVHVLSPHLSSWLDSRMKLQDILSEKRIACPGCRATDFLVADNGGEGELQCGQCQETYQVVDDIPLLLPQDSRTSRHKEDIQRFWQELYQAAYGSHDRIFRQDNWRDLLKKLRNLFERREHLAGVEMELDSLAGKMVLEVGCGAGAHSALFCGQGAKVTSLDITLARVVETNRKLSIVDPAGQSFALQGDSECLPFPDNYFDIVYSNGVLHHTRDTQKAIDEVLRVLQPGGQAIIMLYAKDSFYYWVANYFVQGILRGQKFRHENWLGRSTEWMSSKKQENLNPETKVYAKGQLKQMFTGYAEVVIRKNAFVVQQIPLVGRYLSRLLGLVTGYDQAGTLLYDSAWRNDTSLELWLGRHIGFAYNIKAQKASAS